MSRLERLIDELKRRRVFRVAAVYAVVAFVIWQAAEIAFPALNLPAWALTLVVVLTLIGFPIALVLAWALELTPQGIRRTEPATTSGIYATPTTQGPRPKLRRQILFVSIAVLILAGGYAMYSRFVSAPTSERPQIRSLAVLPLENLSRDSAEDYFADGMTEALITRLSQIGSIEVRARTSAMQYKGARKPMAEIAEELDVDALVEGSVLRVEDRVLITAQLIHGPSDRHLWADSYERDLRDVLSLLSEVAQAIAGEIETVLTPEERARLSRTREVDPKVQEANLKGRYHLVKMTVEGAYRAIEYFEEAIERDPTYAAPYAGLATAWNLLGQPLGAVPTREGMPKAKAAGEKALSLDPDLAEAHSVLGHVSFVYDWDWQKAERLLERAIELDPSSPMAHHAYGVYLANAVGRYEEGIAEGKRAVELDPLSLFYRTGLAEFYHGARQYDRALEKAQEVLDMDRGFGRARGAMMWVYEDLGMCDEYLALRRERLIDSAAEPEALEGQAALERACADSGFVGVWRMHLERRLESIAAGEYVRPSRLAYVYARLGRIDEAFEWLKRAYDERDGNLAFIKTERAYDGLRSDPRFQDLLRRMNFPE